MIADVLGLPVCIDFARNDVPAGRFPENHVANIDLIQQDISNTGAPPGISTSRHGAHSVQLAGDLRHIPTFQVSFEDIPYIAAIIVLAECISF